MPWAKLKVMCLLEIIKKLSGAMPRNRPACRLPGLIGRSFCHWWEIGEQAKLARGNRGEYVVRRAIIRSLVLFLRWSAMPVSSMKSLPLRTYLRAASAIGENIRKKEAINPLYASYKVTNRCNFRCKFCNVWFEKTPVLETELVYRVLDNLERAGVFLLSLEGGEPLLRNDIGDILKYAGAKDYYILFTTSDRSLTEQPMVEYCRNIDFLHISIDEGHDNLDMFSLLPEAVRWGSIVCVQVVVMKENLPALEDKVARCRDAGAKCVIMPAVELNRTRNHFPDLDAFQRECLRLKRKYPRTIISPDPYFAALREPHGCSTGSIIVDCDGGLFYPCRTLESKPVNLLDVDLRDWLHGEEAKAFRRQMATCDRRCGWYQYYAVSAFTSPVHVWTSISPYFWNVLAPRKKQNHNGRK